MLKWLIVLGSLLPLAHQKVFILNVADFAENDLEIDDPPPHADYPKMARWLVHNVEWTAMGTISTQSEIAGFPFVNVIATADSQKGAKSTGQIYFYLTMLDFTAQDLSKRNQLTALFTMDQNLSCTKKNVDPMEPTCARVMISGEALRVPIGSAEYVSATEAMISHHPASVNWVHTHDFFLCKLNISSICVLDWYGGPHYVTIDDYFNAEIDKEKFKRLV